MTPEEEDAFLRSLMPEIEHQAYIIYNSHWFHRVIHAGGCDVEDLIQEGLLTALVAMRRCPDPYKLWGYCMKSAHGKMIQYFTHSWGSVTAEGWYERDDYEEKWGYMGGFHEPLWSAQLVVSQPRHDLLYAALRKLPPNQCKALCDYYRVSLDDGPVEDFTGKNAVGKRCLGLKNLRKILGVTGAGRLKRGNGSLPGFIRSHL